MDQAESGGVATASSYPRRRVISPECWNTSSPRRLLTDRCKRRLILRVNKGPAVFKVARPQPREAHPRTRLFRLLDRARKRKLIWIAGPPGAGKTTLVASYLAQRSLPCLWYQVDEGDGDIATFFHYLGLAARKAAPKKHKPLPHLTPEYLSGLSVFARRYFAELCSRLKRPSILVFDNYQDASHGSRLHEVLSDGVAVTPEEVSVIVMSRSDPPPAFARLRADGAMAEMGWDELRLTVAESQGLARRRHRVGEVGPKKQVIRRMHDILQGWAAGLVLLLERTGGEPLPPASAEFKPAAIFDYFAGEIFDKTDSATQEFLLQSAFLSKIRPRFAEQLTGQPQAGRVLADLHRKNYFTTKHGDPEPFYQYHPLFQAFLVSRAGETFTQERLVRIQRTAAELLESSGQVEDAAGLLRAARDWTGLARLIGQHAPALLAQGRGQTLEAWLRSLPSGMLERTSWLLYWLGACRLPFDPEECRELCERAHALFSTENDRAGLLLAWSTAADCYFHGKRHFERLSPWIERLEEILRKDPTFPSEELEARVSSSMLFALTFVHPEHPAIRRWGQRAAELAQKIEDINLRMQTGFYLAVYYLWMGEFASVGLEVQSLRDLVRRPRTSPLLRLTMITLEALYGFHTASFADSLDKVAEGLKLGEATGVHVWDRHLMEHGAASALSRGDAAVAAGLLQRIAQGIERANTYDFAYYHYLCAWDAMLRGDLARAATHHQAMVASGFSAGPYSDCLLLHSQAQIQHQRGERTEADASLARALESAHRMRSKVLEYMCLLCRAHFAFDRGNEAAGVDDLRAALALGREGGYFNFFWWVSSIMTRLCGRALEHGIEVEYVGELVRRRHLVPEEPLTATDAWPWPLKIYTLGRFSVVKDGKPLELGAGSKRKPLELLIALIALGGSRVSQTKLTDALWPEVEGHLAQQTFEVTLHRLRKLIGQEPALVLKDGKLSLDAHHCWVDSWACEHLLGRIERALHASPARPEDIDRLATRLLALYQGPFLATEAEQPWLLSLRERLRSKFLRQFCALGRHWEAEGKWDKAINGYLQGVEVDPLAEEFYRSLMRCYRRQGRPADACAVYARCRNTLKTVLGVDPSPETETLRRAIEADQTKRS